MSTKIKEKRLPRHDVPKAKKLAWRSMKNHLGAETFYARLLVEKGVKVSTGRNAVDGGKANQEVERLIDEFCSENKKREHGTEEVPVKLGRK